MGVKIDLTGQQFGSLVVIEESDERSYAGHIKWKVKCLECGKEKLVTGSELRNGNVKTCGDSKCKAAYERRSKASIKDLTGQKFNHIIILRDSGNRYNNGAVMWEYQCDCGEKGLIRGDKITNFYCCPKCSSNFSKGEEEIQEYLKEHNINYEKEKTFNTCRFPDTNALARFDFYLPDYNTIIEYDGEQHFLYSSHGWNNEEKFKKTQIRDEFKNNWCKENNILLLRISYKNKANIKNILKDNLNI